MRELFDRPEFQQALAQWPNNAQNALAQLRPLADEGDLAANLFVAWMYPQVGPWNEGIPYARRAADAGIAPVLNNYVGNMAGGPSTHPDMVKFVGVQLDAGWPVDPMAWVPQLLQQGHRDTALQLIRLAMQQRPAGARSEWEELLAATRPAADSIRTTVDEVRAEVDRSLQGMTADEERVAQERERAERLVAEVADLANEGASQHLAKEYATQAAKEEGVADRYTTWAIRLGALAALVTCVIAYLAFAHENGAGAVLTKAALALPILAFTAYVARLAAIHRKQAWRWRHIELQIRTANPFVSPLEEHQRRLLIAALALRFFPGQRHDVEGGTGGETVDPVALLAELLPDASSRRGAPRSASRDTGEPPPEGT